MWNRIVLLALATGIVVPAFASFELVLALDRGNTSVAGRIHRYDGDSGTYLGSFAQGWVNSDSVMAISQANNTVTTGTNGVIRTFNYNTGEMMNSLNVGGFLTAMTSTNSGEILFGISGQNYLGRFDPVANTYTTISLPTGQSPNTPAVSFLATNGNTWYFGDAANTRAWRSVNAGATWTFYSIPSLITPQVQNQAMFSGNSWGDFYISNRSSSNYYYDFGSGANPRSIAGFTATTGLAQGHAGKSFILGATATGSMIQVQDRYQMDGFRFSASQVINPGHLASVVAPEPGTMAALAVGIAAILRKRRKR